MGIWNSKNNQDLLPAPLPAPNTITASTSPSTTTLVSSTGERSISDKLHKGCENPKHCKAYTEILILLPFKPSTSTGEGFLQSPVQCSPITRPDSVLAPHFLYILLACIPAVLLTVLVFTTIYFIRKMKRKDHQRPQKTSPEQDPEDTVHQAPDKNTQVPICPEDEITYAHLTFKQKPPPKTDL